MHKKVCLLLSLAMLLALALSGCRGNELPDGMDEDKVSSAGLAVMSQLTKGEYEEVYDALREDVREQTSAEAIEEMMDAATEARQLQEGQGFDGDGRDGRGRAACHCRHRCKI